MTSRTVWSWRRWRDRLTQVRERRRFLRRVDRALGLWPRGGCVEDRLILKRISTEVAVEWCARDVHPWDRDLAADRREELFLEQCRRDTLIAVRRLFAQLGEVDLIEIRVVEPHASAKTILAGTVARHDLSAVPRQRSPRMSLKLMGIHSASAEEARYPQQARSRLMNFLQKESDAV